MEVINFDQLVNLTPSAKIMIGNTVNVRYMEQVGAHLCGVYLNETVTDLILVRDEYIVVFIDDYSILRKYVINKKTLIIIETKLMSMYKSVNVKYNKKSNSCDILFEYNHLFESNEISNSIIYKKNGKGRAIYTNLPKITYAPHKFNKIAYRDCKVE